MPTQSAEAMNTDRPPATSAAPGAGTDKLPARRRWVFRLIAAAVIPVVFLLVVESFLRLVGFGYPTDFLITHPAAGPEVWVENQRFPWRFFPRTLARHPQPLVVKPAKPEGVRRILVLGESAAEGDPAPAFGFSRILQVLLESRYPQARFEVVNVAFTAINSHVILPIARDCRPLNADFWLVYMGNNEVIGPFGAGTVFGQQAPPLSVVRAGLKLKTTRLGQALDAARQRLTASPESGDGWGGMTMFRRQQVRRDDPRLSAVRSDFRQNLADIVAAGRESGAQVIVATVASRIRDWPPFGSQHRADLTADEEAAWDELYRAGRTSEANGDPAGAIEHFTQAAALDAEFAALHYHWGRCALALGREDVAREHLILARDLDTLRFRTDTPLNETIRDWVAAQRDEEVRLVDAERTFAAASPHGLPGKEWFYEHVHFSFAGNYTLARLFAQAVDAALAASIPQVGPASPEWLSEADCATRLAYDDGQRYEILKLMEARFQEGIYRQQDDYEERLEQLMQTLSELRGQAKPAGRRLTLARCREALTHRPEDWVLHDLAARVLGGLEAYADAANEWQEVARSIPHAARPYTELGRIERLQGRPSEAVAWLDRAIEVNPDFAEAWVERGLVAADQGRKEVAIRDLRRALQIDPTRTEARRRLTELGVRSP